MLDDDYKLKTIKQIDNLISAEIPNEQKYPDYHKKLLKNMIHLPCNHKFSKCIKKGKYCNKKFPKEFQPKTVLDINSYPLYRRRNTGLHDYTYSKQKIKISNR